MFWYYSENPENFTIRYAHQNKTHECIVERIRNICSDKLFKWIRKQTTKLTFVSNFMILKSTIAAESLKGFFNVCPLCTSR